MFGRSASGGKGPGGKPSGPNSPGDRVAAVGERKCLCEATVPASVLDGFACGRADCWRTAEVKASFDGFISDLVRARVASEPPPSPDRAR